MLVSAAARTWSVPAAEIKVVDGVLSRNVPQADYPNDSITVRRVISGGERDISFTVTDTEQPDQGDYYYFKVEQANDAIAWSSPVWVGGYPSR